MARYSVEIDAAFAVSEARKENGSKKRGRTEPCAPSSSKACREKLRRDKLNDKIELRDEKQRLKSEKEKLENQLKSTNPHPGFLPPHQHPSAGGKMIPVYSGVAMWQFMPPAQVDTSQDHALRPPVA